MRKNIGTILAGAAAGILTGLFGAGGGMILLPLLSILTGSEDRSLFGLSVSILLPICFVSLVFSNGWGSFSVMTAFPYLLGSITGGLLAEPIGKKIPNLWLHRILGILILWGGIRYLC